MTLGCRPGVRNLSHSRRVVALLAQPVYYSPPMNMVLILLGAVLFLACLGVIERLWNRKEHERIAQKWEERERLLDRRAPVPTSKEILRRRSRRDQ